MIERRYHTFIASCDRCGKRLPGADSWTDALKATRNAGWESRLVEGDYIDICTDCLFEEKGYDNDENNRQTR